VIVLAAVTLLIGLLAYVFFPARAVVAQTGKTRLEFLGEHREVLYDNLRDLNFEYRAGKYSEEDYRAQRAALESETAQIIAEMMKLEGAKGT
jgi:hypothetical protein